MGKTPDQLSVDELAKFGAAAAKEAVRDLKLRGVAPAGADVVLVETSEKARFGHVTDSTRKAS